MDVLHTLHDLMIDEIDDFDKSLLPKKKPKTHFLGFTPGGSRRAQGAGAALVTAPLRWPQSQRVLQRIPSLKSNHQCRVCEIRQTFQSNRVLWFFPRCIEILCEVHMWTYANNTYLNTGLFVAFFDIDIQYMIRTHFRIRDIVAHCTREGWLEVISRCFNRAVEIRTNPYRT